MARHVQCTRGSLGCKCLFSLFAEDFIAEEVCSRISSRGLEALLCLDKVTRSVLVSFLAGSVEGCFHLGFNNQALGNTAHTPVAPAETFNYRMRTWKKMVEISNSATAEVHYTFYKLQLHAVWRCELSQPFLCGRMHSRQKLQRKFSGEPGSQATDVDVFLLSFQQTSSRSFSHQNRQSRSTSSNIPNVFKHFESGLPKAMVEHTLRVRKEKDGYGLKRKPLRTTGFDLFFLLSIGFLGSLFWPTARYCKAPALDSRNLAMIARHSPIQSPIICNCNDLHQAWTLGELEKSGRAPKEGCGRLMSCFHMFPSVGWSAKVIHWLLPWHCEQMRSFGLELMALRRALICSQ